MVYGTGLENQRLDRSGGSNPSLSAICDKVLSSNLHNIDRRSEWMGMIITSIIISASMAMITAMTKRKCTIVFLIILVISLCALMVVAYWNS